MLTFFPLRMRYEATTEVKIAMKPQYILAAIILACFLVGCGQKGPLKKPPQPEEAVVCNCA